MAESTLSGGGTESPVPMVTELEEEIEMEGGPEPNMGYIWKLTFI